MSSSSSSNTESNTESDNDNSSSCQHHRGSDLSELSERSSVSFGTVEFHEHRVILGDNPSTSCGPSLEIDWTMQEKKVLPIDSYEQHRSPRRSKNQLIMPNQMRTDMLLENGFSLREIRETTAKQRKELSKMTLGKKLRNFLPTRRKSN